MGCNQNKMKLPRVFKRKRATKGTTTWYVEGDKYETKSSSTLEQEIPQKTAQTSNAHCDMPRNGYVWPYEWVHLYDREQLFACMKTCLNYEGFNEKGFHLLTITPGPFLEMKTKQNQPIYSYPWKGFPALERFLRYIPDAIETKVNNDPFVVVIKNFVNESGCSKMCVNLVEKICQRLQKRFTWKLKKICIDRPTGQLAVDISVRKRLNLPFASYEVQRKLVLANHYSLKKLAKATGFPGRLIPEDEIESGWLDALD